MIGSNYNGFALFVKGSTGWEFSNQIEGFYKSVGEFEIDPTSIWVKKDNLLYQIDLTQDYRIFKDIKTYSYLANNDKGNFSVLKINNTILFKTNRFFYRYSQNSNLFFVDKNASKLYLLAFFIHSVFWQLRCAPMARLSLLINYAVGYFSVRQSQMNAV